MDGVRETIPNFTQRSNQEPVRYSSVGDFLI
jgi:hypothetical protein